MSKTPDTVATNVPTAEAAPAVRRRGVMVGAGVLGAAAAAAALLPRAMEDAVPAEKVASTTPQAGGGYRVTEHVQHYYATARV